MKNLLDKPKVNEIYQCLECDFVSEIIQNIESHRKDVHDGNISAEMVNSIESVAIKNNVEDTDTIVDLLYKGVPEPYSVENTSHNCDTCDFQAITEDILENHKKVHKDKPFCSEYPKNEANFKEAVPLSKHLDMHEYEKFPCPLCDLWTTKISLQKHIKVTHENNKRELNQTKLEQKPKNSKKFKSVKKALKNESAVVGVRYPCCNCDYQASKLTDLVTHKESVH